MRAMRYMGSLHRIPKQLGAERSQHNTAPRGRIASVLASMSGWGWAGIGIVGFIILVALAFWPARVARRKGHSWLLFSSSACFCSSPP